MSDGKKTSLLFWLIGIFMVAAVGKVIFWYCVEREDVSNNIPAVPASTINSPPGKHIAIAPSNQRKITPGVKDGSFSLRVNLPLNEETTVHYIVPVDANGKPLPSADNMVFAAPYNGGDRSPVKAGLTPWERYFAEKLGCTIFSLTIESGVEVIGNKDKYYIYKEAGWFELIFKIQERLVKELQLTSKPLLIIGQSSGGAMAQRMAELYPDKIDAAAWVGGITFEPFKRQSNMAWLALNTWGCGGISDTINLKEQAKFYDMQILRGECPPNWKLLGKTHFHHAPSETTYKLIQTFIRDIVRMREQNHEKVPPPECWPVAEIIAGEKQYLPSPEFAALWKQLPHEITRQLAAASNDNNSLLVFPPLDKANRIVLFTQNAKSCSSMMLRDNLEYLAQAGAIPVTFKLSDDLLKDVVRLKQTLAGILAQEEWQTLPVYVVGVDSGGQLAAVAALSNGDKRIKQITTLNSDYESPFEELSIAKHRSRSRIPLKMIYGNADFQPFNNVPDTETVFIDGADQSKQWLTILSEASH